ncbi:MAG: U32 family peptidase [Candidatus Omnitrophica bacterium]|nr:U32 family peptidase [Candidatus Omnitrophota bacterium]
MKILAPLNNIAELEKLKNAGADEIYCGVISGLWQKKYTNIASANRREWSSANLRSYLQLKAIVKEARNCGIKVWCTLNAFYSPCQFEYLIKEIEEIVNSGVDGLIVADIGIMEHIKNNYSVKTIVSTCAATLNSQAASFYRRFSPLRITLPRQLDLSEISQIKKNHPDMEFEVFILNSGCKNIDGFCTFHHGVKEQKNFGLWKLFKKMNLDLGILDKCRQSPALFSAMARFIVGIDSACLLDYKIDISGNIAIGDIGRVKRNIKSYFSLYTGIDPCRACEIYDFLKLDITALKIVGRNYKTARKVKDIIFVKRAIKIAHGCSSVEEFQAKIQRLFEENYGYRCNQICYHR